MPVMLILRGIAGTFGGQRFPRGALDEPPAVEYARRRGFTGHVLDIDGRAFPTSPQMKLALKTFRADPDVGALYGFSGGGYHGRHVLNALTRTDRKRMRLVVVWGAPRTRPSRYKGPWEL